MAILQELIVTVRALRKDLGVPERKLVAIQIMASSRSVRLLQKRIATSSNDLRGSRRLNSWRVEPECANTRTTAGSTSRSSYEQQIDVAAERERLTKDLAQYEKGSGECRKPA